MRRIIAIMVSLFLAPHLAAAACGGSDLVEALETSDKAAHQALFEQAHAVPNGRGIFWRITAGDAPPSYLFGTHPDTGLAAAVITPAVEGALKGSRLLMGEMTEAEQQRLDQAMGSNPAFAIDVDRSGLTAQLSEEQRTLAEQKLADRGVPMKIVDKLRPPILYSILTIPPCVSNSVQGGGLTLSDTIAATAASAGVEIAGLETFEHALGSVAAVPAIDQILLAGLRNLDREEDLHRTGVELYKDAEVAAIWVFDTVAVSQTIGPEAGRRAMAQLDAVMLGTRNQSWVEAMTPELRKGGVFVSVGAMHLPGNAGLIELLRALDFTVERLDG